MELSHEQKIRISRMLPGFYRYMREGTLEHCKRLYKAGMIEEAGEIAEEFHITKEEICILLCS